MYVSSFHFVSLCLVTSIFQIFWSVSSCFTDFPHISYSFHLLRNRNGFIKKEKDECFIVSFRFTLFRNEYILNFFGLFHPVSEFSLYILIVSFVTKQKWVYKKKKR